MHFTGGVSCGGRRKALEALRQGDPAAAVKILQDVERYYVMTVEPEGLSFLKREWLFISMVDAIKVYCTALEMTGVKENITRGRRLLADL